MCLVSSAERREKIDSNISWTRTSWPVSHTGKTDKSMYYHYITDRTLIVSGVNIVISSRLDLVPPPSPAVIASGCPVSYRTPLINSLLQRLSSLFASKSPFQRQGPLNIPELALYPTACQLTTTSMAQWPPCRPQPSSELSTTPSWGHPSQKTC